MRNLRYHVAPRYTPGSPAMVDETTARRVAEQESEAYDYARAGYESETVQNYANAFGVERIAEARLEVRDGWRVEDLITGKTYHRSFAYTITYVRGEGLRFARQNKIVRIREGDPLERWASVRMRTRGGPPLEGWRVYVEKPIDSELTLDALRFWEPDEPKP